MTMEQPALAGGTGAVGCRVLIADDDEEVRRLLRIKLGAAGFEVQEAASAAEVRAAVRPDPPDVLLCEWRLADGEAPALFADLADELGLRTPTVVVLSRFERVVDIERALAAGAQDVVAKPFSPTEVVLRIRVAMARRTLARRRALQTECAP